MNNPKILKRKYWAVELMLDSPLCVSDGESNETDSDVMVNGSDEVFVPGTSLAGAMRDYLELKKDRPGFFGYAVINKNGHPEDGNENNENKDKNKDDVSFSEKGKMSSFCISDLYFDGGSAIVSVRDRVKLNQNRIVDGNGKFDMEVIETGAVGKLFFNYPVREGDDEDEFEDDIIEVLQGIQNGYIRFGSVKTRGFGQFKIKWIYQRTFDYETVKEDDLTGWIGQWTDFKKNSRDLKRYSDKMDYEHWLAEEGKEREKKFIRISVPLKLTGGISIRVYSTRPKDPDYGHITCNGKPVVPGTSWAGAIRADAREILHTICAGNQKADQLENGWFGYVSEEERKALQSRVIIGESVIKDSRELQMTRTKINRFDGSAIDKALYTESAYFGGSTVLEILVRRSDSDADDRALLELLAMVIEDIRKGYVPVGGEVAIGRGIFAPNGPILYEGEQPDENGRNLYARIQEDSNENK